MIVSEVARRLAWPVAMPSTMPDGRTAVADEVVIALVRELAAEPVAREAMRAALGWTDLPIDVLVDGAMPDAER